MLTNNLILFYKRTVFLKIIACTMICRNNEKISVGHYKQAQFNALTLSDTGFFELQKHWGGGFLAP